MKISIRQYKKYQDKLEKFNECIYMFLMHLIKVFWIQKQTFSHFVNLSYLHILH